MRDGRIDGLDLVGLVRGFFPNVEASTKRRIDGLLYEILADAAPKGTDANT